MARVTVSHNSRGHRLHLPPCVMQFNRREEMIIHLLPDSYYSGEDFFKGEKLIAAITKPDIQKD